jgi:hypothetical protein
VRVRTNEDRGTNNGWPASSQGPVENNGQSFVGDDVAEEQCDQDPVLAALEEPQHPRGILALVGFARVGEDFEVDFVLSHEPVQC